MSCCGGKCGCGAGCNCGSSCGGCKMYPDLRFSGERVSTETTIVGVGPEKTFFEGSEMGMAAENDCCGAGCKCGPNCGCGAACHCCK